MTLDENLRGEGVVSITFTPIVCGSYRMIPTVNGEPLAGSPYNVSFVASSFAYRLQNDTQVCSFETPLLLSRFLTVVGTFII